LRFDHISIEAMLPGVWQVSYKRDCDPDSREMNRGLVTTVLEENRR